MGLTTVQPALEITPSSHEIPKGEREYAAFLRLLPQLLATHTGQFVAIHDEPVIDSDQDDITLVRRVHARIGYVPIHVGLVTEQQPLVRIPHYRASRILLDGPQLVMEVD
jgi:hypothetical protein